MPWCVCSTCHETFTCVDAFDKHRVGPFGEPLYVENPGGKSHRIVGHTPSQRRCLREAEMLARGMAKNARGRWMTRPSVGLWTGEPQEERAPVPLERQSY